MSLYNKLANNKTCVNLVRKTRKIYFEKEKRRRVKAKYTFIDRSNHRSNLCIILAGYKEILWNDVFGRIKKYAPKDIDVCIVSSGLYSKKLDEIAKNNNWSYLSVKKNKVTLAQNVAINLFQDAKMIYKLDEDIFVTKNFFKNLMNTYEKAQEDYFKVGFVAPLIPINGYAHVRVLEKIGLINNYENKFGKAKHDWDTEGRIVKNSEVAKFMWGESEIKLRDIDKLDNEFSKEEFKYSICPIRFSIGAILFSRKLWDDMGRFKVGIGNNMGVDEIQICNYLLSDSRTIIVSENTLVGHFSFGPQTKEMLNFYEKNRNIFKVK